MTNEVASQPTYADWAVTQTIHKLFYHLDEHDFEAVAALFLGEGTWLRQGGTLVGPQGVLRALLERPTNLSTRHLVTNLVIEGSADACEARYYATAFDYLGDLTGPAPLTVPHAIFVCTDRLLLTADGWRFAHRSPRPVFKRP